MHFKGLEGQRYSEDHQQTLVKEKQNVIIKHFVMQCSAQWLLYIGSKTNKQKNPCNSIIKVGVVNSQLFSSYSRPNGITYRDSKELCYHPVCLALFHLAGVLDIRQVGWEAGEVVAEREPPADVRKERIMLEQ